MALSKAVEEAFTCQNVLCRQQVDCDHVTVITTKFMRRFCSMHCVVEGFEEHNRRGVQKASQWVDELFALRETPGWSAEKEAEWLRSH